MWSYYESHIKPLWRMAESIWNAFPCTALTRVPLRCATSPLSELSASVKASRCSQTGHSGPSKQSSSNNQLFQSESDRLIKECNRSSLIHPPYVISSRALSPSPCLHSFCLTSGFLSLFCFWLLLVRGRRCVASYCICMAASRTIWQNVMKFGREIEVRFVFQSLKS